MAFGSVLRMSAAAREDSSDAFFARTALARMPCCVRASAVDDHSEVSTPSACAEGGMEMRVPSYGRIDLRQN